MRSLRLAVVFAVPLLSGVAIGNPVLAQNADQLNACRSYTAQQLSVAPNAVGVYAGYPVGGAQVVRWRTAGRQGTCTIRLSDSRIVGFNSQVLNGTLTPPPRLPASSYNLLPGLGHIAVVDGTFANKGNRREFDATVDGRRSRWWADCSSLRIGRYDPQVNAGDSDAARSVARYVCARS